jgi:hypothetical protein
MRALALASTLALACQPDYDYRDTVPGRRGIVETPVRDYPFGDAVDVYRAALDLLYIEGTERPRVIVLRDSAILRYGSPCPHCGWYYPHKSRIDTSTIEAFAKIPPVKPRLRKFSYEVPIHVLTNEELAEVWTAGQAYDSTHPNPREMPQGYDREFLERHPGAWGSVDFSLVGFNRAQNEALLEVRQFCGIECHSIEVVFFRKVRYKWVPIERLPQEVQVWHRTLLRYRGPVGGDPGHSELLADQRGHRLRTNSKDAPGVYSAVLDSLYSFHGEKPRMIVISDEHAQSPAAAPLPSKHQIDSATKAALTFQSAIRDRMNPRFSYNVPITIISYKSKDALDREGIPLEREAKLRVDEEEETNGFWLAFRSHYPGAWGYVELGRIAFNPEHTEALVLSTHRCGSQCAGTDVWLVTREGEKWSAVERTPGFQQNHWQLDSLRYIGLDADAKAYRPRRAHGVFSNAVTGAVLPSLDVTFQASQYAMSFKTDSAGRYTFENLPLNRRLAVKVKCPAGSSTTYTIPNPILSVRPGLDTTLNVAVDLRDCDH